MTKPLVDRIPFAKILIGLVIIFGLSLGLCGLEMLAGWKGKGLPGNLMNKAAGFEVLAMLLSAGGIVITAIIWMVLKVASSFTREK